RILKKIFLTIIIGLAILIFTITNVSCRGCIGIHIGTEEETEKQTEEEPITTQINEIIWKLKAANAATFSLNTFSKISG
ncbi:unnamed protein product, partial [marine sediment metagenome]